MDELIKFIKLTHKFQDVKRIIKYPGKDDRETDPEHSYQLAMTAWYIISTRKIPLDLSLVIKYALVHDLVEAHAGDVSFYRSKNEDKEKEKKEKLALEKLVRDFPEFRDLHHLINQYEKQATKESQFVYALDKLIPVINIYLDNGRTWKEHDISMESLIKNKTEKIKKSEEVNRYLKELIVLLEKDPSLFSQK